MFSTGACSFHGTLNALGLNILYLMESIGSSIAKKQRDQNIRLEGADVLTSKGYALVPRMLMKDKALSAAAKLVYVMLLLYAWQDGFCFPGQKRLAEDIGFSERKAHSAIKELQKRNLISIKRRGQGMSNIYTLHLRVEKKEAPDS